MNFPEGQVDESHHAVSDVEETYDEVLTGDADETAFHDGTSTTSNDVVANPQDTDDASVVSQGASREHAGAGAAVVLYEAEQLQQDISVRRDIEPWSRRRSLGSSTCLSESRKTNGAVRRSSVQWAEDLGVEKRISTTDSLPDSTGGSSSSTKKNNIWTRMAKKSDVWDDEDNDEADLTCEGICSGVMTEINISMKAKWSTFKSHPHIGIITSACFLVLFAASIAITITFADQYKRDRENEVLKIADDLGLRFRDQLAAATLPLFSMVEFVKELPYFKDLPFEIGQGGQPGSAPYINDTVITHRRISGICDNSTLVEDFNRIARNIKEGANMTGVLLNLQLAPEAVVCLVYPVNNTEDFTPPLYLDNSGALGIDNLIHPGRRNLTEKSIPAKDVVIAGPISLPVRACNESTVDCPIAVQNAFIAWLSIFMPPELGYNITVRGISYSSWGFAVALINGDALVNRTEAFDEVKRHKFEFVLSKTDSIFNMSTNQVERKNVVLAISDNADLVRPEDFANVTVNTTNGDWTMAVGYVGGFQAPWLGWAIVVSVFLSLALATMLMIILLEKQAHKDLLREMLPRNALQKIQRGATVVEKYNMVTIFFSEIVGYTSMSAEMRPIEVMKMLNSFYNEVDKLADKHKVYKIDTIGDSYMCVGGCPDRCLGPEGAEHVAMFALDLIGLVKNFRTDDGSQILIRAGINSGPVVAGVVGTKRPQYTVFGDAVNAAARMESTSENMKIQCSDITHHLLRDAPNYTFSLSERGGIEVKGKGHMNTWFIESASEGVQYSGRRSPRPNPQDRKQRVESFLAVDSTLENSDLKTHEVQDCVDFSVAGDVPAQPQSDLMRQT